jgi:HD-GYP domain-containing protein (c-di-GMP phosphodiesterase class II)
VYQTIGSAPFPDVQLGVALNARIHDVAASALDAMAPRHRTVAAEIVAMRFVERFSASVSAGDWAPLLKFVDDACGRYAGILPMADLIAVAVDATGDLVGSVPNPGLTAADLDGVRRDVERLSALPRLVRVVHREAIDEVDVALDDLITRLDLSDELTAEHSRAVAAWCARLAERMSLSKQDTIEIARSGLIHDIGKISTPLEILNAPRGLTPDEFVVMQRHAADGGDVVNALPLVAHLLPAVRNHHERIDGSGYPDGLAGTRIPSSARIVCVADAFNAMIGRRPYRAPLAPSIALERLVAGRGTQFDPIVVDAMVDVVTTTHLQRIEQTPT